jgi:hypothetical protein
MSLQENERSEDRTACSALLQLLREEEQIQRLRPALSTFSHRYRNLLNGMKMALYFVRREAGGPMPPSWTEIELNYRAIELRLDELQTIYRPVSLTAVRAPMSSLMRDRERTWQEWFRGGTGSLQVAPPDDEIPVEFDPMFLGMALDTLARWRAPMVSPEFPARLSWNTSGGSIELIWEETRPAPPEQEEEEAVAGGREPMSRVASIPSLALPLLARVAAAHGGSLEWSRSPSFRLAMKWPQSQERGCTRARSSR